MEVEGWMNDSPTELRIPDLALTASEMTVNVIELSDPSTALISLPGSCEPEVDPVLTEVADEVWNTEIRCLLNDVEALDEETLKGG